MVRVTVVDDHPAVRAGLHGLLRSEPGLVPVGSAASAGEVWDLIHRSRPDVLLVDYQLAGDDGLVLCRRVKSAAPEVRVLVYSAYTDDALAVPAKLAGADGVVGKGAPAEQLFDAVRSVARGEHRLPAVKRPQVDAATVRLEPDDLPVLGMVLDGSDLEEIAEVVGEDRAELEQRIERMIVRLASADARRGRASEAGGAR